MSLSLLPTFAGGVCRVIVASHRFICEAKDSNLTVGSSLASHQCHSRPFHGVFSDYRRVAVTGLFRLALVSSVASILAFSNGASAAAYPGIDAAKTWLKNSVQAGGAVQGEASSVASLIQVRSEVALALAAQSVAPSEFIPVANATVLEATSSAEMFSRQLMALSAAGLDGAAVLSSLLLLQGADGGFSPAAGYAASVWDTAWAVLALARSGQASAAATESARRFIANQITADGTFGDGTLQDQLLKAAMAQMALRTGSEQSYAAGISTLSNGILANRSANGAWLDDAYVTALVWMSFGGSLSSSVDVDRIHTFFAASQQANGSWGLDPYLTALIVRSLSSPGSSAPAQSSVTGRLVETGSVRPISGASLQLAGAGASLSVTTSQDGRFTFSQVPVGQLTLSGTKQGYSPLSRSISVSAAGLQVLMGDVQMDVEGSTGIVRGTTSIGSTGTALEGTTVTVSTSPPRSAISSSAGQFEVLSVPPGSWEVTFSKSGYQTTRSTVQVVAAQSVTIAATLYAMGEPVPGSGSVKGRVVMAGSGNPISGASLQINGMPSQLTAADGSFIATAAAGSVTVDISALGYASFRTTLNLTAGSTADLGTITLTQAGIVGAKLSGVVTKPGGTALAGAMVKVGDRFATTDVGGRYAIDGLQAALVTVRTEATRYITQSAQVRLESGSEYFHNVLLYPENPSGIQLTSLQAAPIQVGANEDVIFTSSLANTGPDHVALSGKLDLLDGTGKFIATGYLLDASGNVAGEIVIAPGATTPLSAKWNSGRQLPANLTANLRLIAAGTVTTEAPSGLLLASATTSVSIGASEQYLATISADPPLLQAGSTIPVKLFVVLQNSGNSATGVSSFRLSGKDDSGSIVYSQMVSSASSEVSGVQTLYFPQWSPAAAGNFTFTLTRDGQPSQLTSAKITVGDVPLVAYSLDKSNVSPASPVARASVSIAGVDPLRAVISDPLAPVIKTAIQRAVTFGDSTAFAWARANGCSGCHIATQAIVGGESSRGIAAFNASERRSLINQLAASANTDGLIVQLTQTMLGLWALGEVPNRGSLQGTRVGAAELLMSIQGAHGEWNPDNLDAWWKHPVTSTAFNLQSFARLHRDLMTTPSTTLPRIQRKQWVADSRLASAGFMAKDLDGSILISNSNAGTILRVTQAGAVSVAASGLNQPRGLLVEPSGQVVVTTLSGLIRIELDGRRTLLTSMQGTGLVRTASGTYLMARNGFNDIIEVTSAGTTSTWLTSSLLSGPFGLEFDPQGNLVVVNSSNGSIVRVNPSKAVEVVIASMPSQTLYARHIQGKWYLGTYYGIWVYDQDWIGERLVSTVTQSDIVMLDSGSLALSNSSGSIDLVAASEYETESWVSDSRFGSSYYMASDAEGNVYASAYYSGHVSKVTPSGQVSLILSGLSFPRGLAIDAGGLLYVATNNGILRRNTDGSTTVISPVHVDGITFGPDGNLYASVYSPAKLMRVSLQGEVLELASGGPLNGPQGVGFSPAGDLHVVNYGDYRMLRLKQDRTLEVVFVGSSSIGNFRGLQRSGSEWLVGTSTGVYRLDGSYSRLEQLSKSNAEALAIRPDGIVVSKNPTVASLNRLLPGVRTKASFVAKLDASIARAHAWLLNDSNANNLNAFGLSHRIVGLVAAAEHYSLTSSQGQQALTRAAAIGEVLKARQNADGGWGLNWVVPNSPSNSASDSLVTAQVMYALDLLDPSASSPEVRNAVTWLLSRQQADGSWLSETNQMATKVAATTWATISLRQILDRVGAIDTQVTLSFAPDVKISAIQPPASSIQTLATGEAIHTWDLVGVTAAGRTISFDVNFQGIRAGETRKASHEAYLSFKNGFTGEVQRSGISIPFVLVDSIVSLSLQSDAPAYQANATAQFNAGLTSSSSVAGQLKVSVFDANGILVKQAHSGAVSLAAGQQQTVPIQFAIGTIAVGTYKARAQVLDAGGQIAAIAEAQFDVLPDTTPLIGRVITDRSSYDSNDLVEISGRLYNRSANVSLANHVIREEVRTPAGALIYSVSRAFRQVAPSAYADAVFSFRLAAAVKGQYQVRQEILNESGTVVHAANAAFEVLDSTVTGAGLRGQVVPDSNARQRGDSINLSYSVSNAGNAAYSTLPLTLRAIDMATQTAYVIKSESVVLPQGGNQSGSAVWATASLPKATSATAGLKTYVLALYAELAGQEKVLAQDVVTLGDLQPVQFAPITNAERQRIFASNSISLSGIASSLTASITSGEMSINGAAFSSAAAQVRAGDQIQVRVQSSPEFSTTVIASLKLSIVEVPFAVTTLAADTLPDAMVFAPQVGVPVTSERTSNQVTISGINTQVPISIVGGSYSINGGAFTQSPSTVMQGDVVSLRLISASAFSATTSAVLTVGTGTATFSVTTESADTVPDGFSFAPQVDVPVSAERDSNAVTITGINTGSPISVAGGNYSINGGVFTAVAGTVKAGDRVVARARSADGFSTPASATVTVGGVSGVFTVTTLAADTTPDPFSFVAQTDVLPGVERTSNAITVAGINTTSPVSVVGGSYSVNGAAFVTIAGTVKAGDTVTVRQTSSVTPGIKTSAVLTIGGVIASFDVTTQAADTTPDAFSFAAQTDVPLGAERTSNTITMAGINTASPVSITGGTYSLNGGAYVATAGTVKLGDTVTVRQTSSAAPGTKTSVVLTIGGVSASFDVTTQAADTTPDPFSFTAQTDVPLSSVRTSNTVTIAGINSPAPVSIVVGSYSLNGGAYVATAGTVKAGDTVTVRQTSSATAGTKTSAVLTIGGVSASFDVTTQAADTTPDAFTFTAQTGVPLSSVRTSNTVTVAGLSTSVPVSVSTGSYSLNGGAYVSTAGTIKAGDTLTIRQTASGQPGTTSTVQVTVGTYTTPFSVTSEASVAPTVSATFAGPARVLVLVSCGSGDDDDDDRSEFNPDAKAARLAKSDDDDDDNVSLCESQKQQFIASYLTSLGIPNKVVTSVSEFRKGLRCGEYNTYWLAGGAIKLASSDDDDESGSASTLMAELIEAIHRGDTLILDGVHDSRNAPLYDVAGVKYSGKLSSPGAVVVSGTGLPAVSYSPAGDALKLTLEGGARQAGFGSAGGNPAIVTAAYGLGKAVILAYDHVATAQGQPTSANLQNLLAQLIKQVTPAARSTEAGDARTTLTLTVTNPGSGAESYEVIGTLPPAAEFITAAPTTSSQSGSQYTWTVNIPAGQSTAVVVDFFAPKSSGTYAIPISIRRAGTVVASASASFTVAGADQSASVVSQVQALAPTSSSQRQARDKAAGHVQAGNASLAANQFEAATASYLKAIEELDKIDSVSTSNVIVAIDRLLQETGRRWCRAGASCPASSIAPQGYNVMVFDTASFTNGEAWGSIGVGGDVSLSSFSVASRLLGDTARLVADGDVSFNNGSVGQGGSGVIYAGDKASVSQSVGRAAVYADTELEDWDDLKDAFKDYSDNLAGRSGTIATIVSGNQFNCTGTNASFNVCKLTGSQLAQARSLNLNYPAGSTVLVNVSGSSATLTNGQANFNGQPLLGNAAAARVLFNFADMTSLTINGFGLGGTILAPRAKLSHSNNAIDGQVIVDTLTSSGSYRCSGVFQGVVPAQ